MVEFKSWRDAYIFLKDYCNASCLNCFYGGARVDLSEEHTDSEYVHLFCTENISMVRLDMMVCCAKWEHQETRKNLKDYGDKPVWNLTDEVIDKIDETGVKLSIDEIREIIGDDKVTE